MATLAAEPQGINPESTWGPESISGPVVILNV